MRRITCITLLILLTAFSAFSGQLNFSEFQYITNYETTLFGENIKFFNGDTLWGWVHSNDQIAIMQSPVFFGPVTTVARQFWEGMSYNPVFYIEPVFNYSTAEFPEELTTIREAATEQGLFIAETGYQFRLIFEGQHGERILKWPEDMPYSDSVATLYATWPVMEDGAAFFDSDLQVMSTNPVTQINYGVSGRYSVGASGDVRIMDNLMYIDVLDPVTGQVDSTTTNCLGLASEQNILIANTRENGSGNGWEIAPNNPWRNSIALNGAFLALGESFSFEDQNDDSTTGGGLLPEWYYSEGTSPDERGWIHLWGTIAQYRRGYVHRSNNGGTGYLKGYHYYNGIRENPPPYFPALEIALDFEVDNFDFGEIVGPGMFELSMAVYNWSMDTIEVYSINASHPAFSITMTPPDTILPADSAMVTLTFEPDSNGFYEESVNIITNYEGDYNLPIYAQVEGLAVENRAGEIHPQQFRLSNVYPNPFNSAAVFEFENPVPALVEITIFDVSGRAVFHDAPVFDSGVSSYVWEPVNLASGFYLFKVNTENSRQTGKLLYLR